MKIPETTGSTHLCCDTDALTIVASRTGGMVTMPNGAPPIKALPWNQVEQIADRFDSLSPYNRAIVPHLLRLTDENYDKNGKQRQLFGLSIAAKRYALYTTRCKQPFCEHRKCVEIIDPKAHGLIFFAPSEEREGGSRNGGGSCGGFSQRSKLGRSSIQTQTF